MKTLLKTRKDLQKATRWDIDFHLPAEGIKRFPKGLLKRVDEVAAVVKDKRDPTKDPATAFQYIDISAVDVSIGCITNPQDLEGAEAPSRARKVVRAFDLVISTCRPTRGAIAVVPVTLHNQIASTGFSVIRCHDDVNPFYIHYALRLPSTLEQFRKWSTGSSYPAILDSDVKKTLIPVPDKTVQDEVAARVMAAMQERSKVIKAANAVWSNTLDHITATLSGTEPVSNIDNGINEDEFAAITLAQIQEVLRDLPSLVVDNNIGDIESEDELLSQSELPLED